MSNNTLFEDHQAFLESNAQVDTVESVHKVGDRESGIEVGFCGPASTRAEGGAVSPFLGEEEPVSPRYTDIEQAEVVQEELAPASVFETRKEPEPEPQPQPQAEPEPQPQPQAEPEPEPEPEPQPQVKPEMEAQPQVKPEMEAQPQAQAKLEPEPEPQPQAQGQAKPEMEAQAEPQLKTEPKEVVAAGEGTKQSPKKKKKAKAKAKAKAESKPKVNAKAKAKAESKPKAKAKAKAKAESKPKANPKPKPKAKPKPKTSVSGPGVAHRGPLPTMDTETNGKKKADDFATVRRTTRVVPKKKVFPAIDMQDAWSRIVGTHVVEHCHDKWMTLGELCDPAVLPQELVDESKKIGLNPVDFIIGMSAFSHHAEVKDARAAIRTVSGLFRDIDTLLIRSTTSSDRADWNCCIFGLYTDFLKVETAPISEDSSSSSADTLYDEDDGDRVMVSASEDDQPDSEDAAFVVDDEDSLVFDSTDDELTKVFKRTKSNKKRTKPDKGKAKGKGKAKAKSKKPPLKRRRQDMAEFVSKAAKDPFPPSVASVAAQKQREARKEKQSTLGFLPSPVVWGTQNVLEAIQDPSRWEHTKHIHALVLEKLKIMFQKRPDLVIDPKEFESALGLVLRIASECLHPPAAQSSAKYCPPAVTTLLRLNDKMTDFEDITGIKRLPMVKKVLFDSNNQLKGVLAKGSRMRVFEAITATLVDMQEVSILKEKSKKDVRCCVSGQPIQAGDKVFRFLLYSAVVKTHGQSRNLLMDRPTGEAGRENTRLKASKLASKKGKAKQETSPTEKTKCVVRYVYAASPRLAKLLMVIRALYQTRYVFAREVYDWQFRENFPNSQRFTTEARLVRLDRETGIEMLASSLAGFFARKFTAQIILSGTEQA
jgi:hypothetical protein